MSQQRLFVPVGGMDVKFDSHPRVSRRIKLRLCLGVQQAERRGDGGEVDGHWLSST